VWLHGYAHRANWRALLWTRKQAKSLFFGDSELLHYRTPLRRLAKQAPVRWFFSQCDAFFTIGDNNAAYYRHYGVPEAKLVRGACPVDMSRFTLSPQLRAAYRQSIRSEFHIPDKALVVVFSGKFQDYKRPLDLIEACAMLPDFVRRSVHLLFIGEGPLRPQMKQLAEAHGIDGQVHFTGFVNQKDMPRCLAAGDVLAITSERDAHPLTVTEALPYGMPIISSDRVGCVGPTDTARPGENALVYRCGDKVALSQNILALTTMEESRRTMGEISRRIAPTQDIQVAADAVQVVWERLHR
jgi:glycosyltransferase involved in cell wall biosynthesis